MRSKEPKPKKQVMFYPQTATVNQLKIERSRLVNKVVKNKMMIFATLILN